MEEKYRHQNALLLYRKRMGFSQKYVAALLGHRTTQMLSGYERGHCLPSLVTALRLEVIYRVPVAFLYGRTYDAIRLSIRETEERFAPPRQQVLF